MSNDVAKEKTGESVSADSGPVIPRTPANHGQQIIQSLMVSHFDQQ